MDARIAQLKTPEECDPAFRHVHPRGILSFGGAPPGVVQHYTRQARLTTYGTRLLPAASVRRPI
jgi:hypothetical protein